MKCTVCGKPCKPWERNTDGTFTHSGCLTMLTPVARGPKGGNLYNQPSGETE